MLDNYHFLIVQTFKSGRVRVLVSGDNKEAIEDNYLYLCRLYGEEIAEGKSRIDIYEG